MPSLSFNKRSLSVDTVKKNLLDALAEIERLNALVNTQALLHELEKSNSLSARLGTILIDGADSVGGILGIPRRLISVWRQSRKKAPPSGLGGEGFSKVLAAYQEGGFTAVDALLVTVPALPSVKGNAYTALARSLQGQNAEHAAYAARRAYAEDPKPFRLKWLACRLHEAGAVLEAEAMLDVLPEDLSFSESEERQVRQIRREASRVRLRMAERLVRSKNRAKSKSGSGYKHAGRIGGDALVMAEKIRRIDGLDAALNYAKDNLPADLEYTINVINANCAATERDQGGWISYVNSYLSRFSISPIELRGEGSILEKLSSTPRVYVEDGPKISVLIAAFNSESTIEMSVGSILNQSWGNIELIIVDDCSSDGTWDVVGRIVSGDCRVRAFRNSVHVGPYVSKNIALAQSTGEWVTTHGAGDWAHPERLSLQCNFCVTGGHIACLSKMVQVTNDCGSIKISSIGEWGCDGVAKVSLASLMVRSSYFYDVLGCWDSVKQGGDMEIIRRIEAIENKKIPQMDEVTIFSKSDWDGLLGDDFSGGESDDIFLGNRYEASYSKFHADLDKLSSRFSFFSKGRRFYAPEEMLNNPEDIIDLINGYGKRAICMENEYQVDLAIITNLRFPGGNASSTLDEVRFFVEQGLRVLLIHCPSNGSLGKDISDRYASWKHLIVNWFNVGRLEAKVLICRAPSVVVSSKFRVLAPKLCAQHVFVVKNNSYLRPNGAMVYRLDEMIAAAKKINSKEIIFCPIGPSMRYELYDNSNKHNLSIDISILDWTPTFNLTDYKIEPKASLLEPFKIGRHGRDGAEKWLEGPEALLRAYPDDSDFVISILGGADQAARILGELPKNWVVKEFNSISPREYLEDLDVFVYFPNSGLVEAFGRTIVEAMIAGVPVILPPSFHETFGDLPLYCHADQVEGLVRRLASMDSKRRIQYLIEVQEFAEANFSSAVIASRLSTTSLVFPDIKPRHKLSLSSDALSFRVDVGGFMRDFVD